MARKIRDQFDERAREKQTARDADALALAEGRVSVDDLNRRNEKFAFPHVRVRLDRVASFT